MEGLVGPLAPDTGGVQARADEIAEAVADICLAIVSKVTRNIGSDLSVDERPTGTIRLKTRP